MPNWRGRCLEPRPELTSPRSLHARILPIVSAVALALMTVAMPARAKDPEPIVLVHDLGQELLTGRVRDELDALGWLVVEIVETDGAQSIEALAQRVHAVAAVHIERAGELELWVASTTGLGAFHESVRFDASDPETAALRAVEVVRTRFLELGLTPRLDATSQQDRPALKTGDPPSAAPPEAERAAGPSLHALDASRAAANERPSTSPTQRGTPPLRLGVAPAVATSPGGLRWTPLVSVGFRVATKTRWSFGAGAAFPLVAQTVESALGSADVKWGSLLAKAELALTPPGSDVEASLMGGTGAVLVHMEGKAERPYAGRVDSVVAFAACAGPALAFSLSRTVMLRSELWGGVALPRPTVRFAGQTVAAWGQPFALATLGVEVGVGQ